MTSYPKTKMTMQLKPFILIQNTETVKTTQLKTRKKTSRTTSDSGKNDGVSMWKQQKVFVGGG